jgi:putative ABC transport system permease protein
VAAAFVEPVGDPGPHQPLLIALDTKAYERVVRGTPAAVHLPASLLQPPPIAIGMPTLLSPGWPGGSPFSLPTDSGATVSFVGVGQYAGLPGVAAGTPYALVALPVFEQAVKKATGFGVPPTRLYVRAPASALGTIRRLVAAAAPGSTVSTRAGTQRALRASPLVSSALRGFRAAIIVAALYAVLAAMLMVLVSARNRARDLAYLRTLGASPRQGLATAATELAPLTVGAVALGVGFGIAIPPLLAPGLHLGFFTGGAERPPLALDWPVPVAVALGLLAVVAAAVLAASAGARRAGLGRVLRIGER